MAKLSAHGFEVARVKRVAMDSAGSDPYFTEMAYTYSFRSDGHILRKMTGRETDSGKIHSWGWKLWKKIRTDVDTTSAFRKILRKWVDLGVEVVKISPSLNIEMPH